MDISARRAFLETYFQTPRQVRLGVWMIISGGSRPTDAKIRRNAALPPNANMFDYADALIEYASNRGWSEELTELLKEDLEEALRRDGAQWAFTRGNRAFLNSRFRGRLQDHKNA
jgi:hypothetical protein